MARAILNPHELLLLDEPVAGVNPKIRNIIGELIIKMKNEGKGVLLIEHDMVFTLGVSDYIIVMDAGRVIAEGLPQDIRNNDALARQPPSISETPVGGVTLGTTIFKNAYSVPANLNIAGATAKNPAVKIVETNDGQHYAQFADGSFSQISPEVVEGLDLQKLDSSGKEKQDLFTGIFQDAGWAIGLFAGIQGIGKNETTKRV